MSNHIKSYKPIQLARNRQCITAVVARVPGLDVTHEAILKKRDGVSDVIGVEIFGQGVITGVRRRALKRGNESKDLRIAKGDTIGEAERLYPIVLGDEVIRNHQLISCGKPHFKVNPLPSS